MIPILYEKTETAFTSNGLGRLSDCISCIVTEERNGIYECEFDYPVTGVHFDDIQIGRIISCTHDEQGDAQPFDIYAKSEPINGVVTFRAHHISYRLNEITVEPFTAGSCTQAIANLQPKSIGTNPFTFTTDKSVSGDYKVTVPTSCRALLGGSENSILDVYGTGEYDFDKFTVSLKVNRGQDTNVSIRYGKNLIDFQNDIDYGNTYNAVAPFWLGEVYDDSTGVSTQVLVTLPEKYISSGQTLPGGRLVIVPMDLSDQFNGQPSEADLRTLATSRLTSGYAWVPSQNITVDFVQLWQTEEYKQYAPLQRVRLCDTVLVDVPMYNVTGLRIKVIKVVYNVLLDRYDEMELGSPQTTLAGAISQSTDISSQIQNALDQYTHQADASIYNAIQNATDLITGGLGGYVHIVRNANGKPIELVIADNEDLSLAVNVWRWNQNGIGYSSTGYNGTFTTAWTIDGNFVADFITTGILNANLIKAGTISDDSGLNYWNLVSGFLQTKQGQLGPFAVNPDSLVFEPADGKSSITIYSYQAGGFTLPAIRVLYKAYYPSEALDITTSGIYYYKGSGSTIDESVYYGLGTSIHSYGSGYGPPYVMGFHIGSDYMYDLLGFYPERQNTDEYAIFNTPLKANAGFQVTAGTKSKVVKTLNYSARALYCYETPTPLFGDIGEAVLDEEGICYVDIDDIFSETIAEQVEYQVFLQKEGEGDCWIAEKHRRYFVIQGTPNLSVAWELKAKQRDFETYRLELDHSEVGQYARIKEDKTIENYITEQEELLYG